LHNDQSGSVLGDGTVFSWAGCHRRPSRSALPAAPAAGGRWDRGRKGGGGAHRLTPASAASRRSTEGRRRADDGRPGEARCVRRRWGGLPGRVAEEEAVVAEEEAATAGCEP
jgi:hypothetical protein